MRKSNSVWVIAALSTVFAITAPSISMARDHGGGHGDHGGGDHDSDHGGATDRGDRGDAHGGGFGDHGYQDYGHDEDRKVYDDEPVNGVKRESVDPLDYLFDPSAFDDNYSKSYSAEYCRRLHPSYNSKTGSYLGHDGYIHYCS